MVAREKSIAGNFLTNCLILGVLKKLLLLLLAPCAAPAATLVQTDGEESVVPRAEIVEKAARSQAVDEKKSRFSTLTKRYFSPVARAIGGLRQSLSSSVVIELEEETALVSLNDFESQDDLIVPLPQSDDELEISHYVYEWHGSSVSLFTRTVRFTI